MRRNPKAIKMGSIHNYKRKNLENYSTIFRPSIQIIGIIEIPNANIIYISEYQ